MQFVLINFTIWDLSWKNFPVSNTSLVVSRKLSLERFFREIPTKNITNDHSRSETDGTCAFLEKVKVLKEKEQKSSEEITDIVVRNNGGWFIFGTASDTNYTKWKELLLNVCFLLKGNGGYNSFNRKCNRESLWCWMKRNILKQWNVKILRESESRRYNNVIKSCFVCFENHPFLLSVKTKVYRT